MERSWDYLLKTPLGQFAAILAALFVMVFIVAGGLYMRSIMIKDRLHRESLRNSKDSSDS